MNIKYRAFTGLVLLAGLGFLIACSTTSNPNSIGVMSDTQCNQNQDFCNVLQGYIGNSIANGVTSATISGGGLRGAPNQVTANNGTVGGGEANLAGEGSVVAGG